MKQPNNLYWAYGGTVFLLLILVIYELEGGGIPEACGKVKDAVGFSVLVAGMLGGFVSSITRGIHDPTLEMTAPGGVIFMQKTAHVLLGGIFSIVLYLMFAGDMVAGSLFPDFAQKSVGSFEEFLCNARPVETGDYAKALVWGFIAGYSQTLVPNFFDKMIENVEQPNPPVDKPAEGPKA